MNRTKLLTIAVIGLLLINIGMLCFLFFDKTKTNHREEPMNGPQHEGPKKIIIERLHFDNKQEEVYSVIVDEHRAKSRELNKRGRDLHDELYVLLLEYSLNALKADSLILEIAENQKAIDYLNLEHFQKIKAICKPNQINDFNDLVSDLTKLFSPHPPKRN